ncbi:MAG: hypothetical protein RMJ98_21600 [Myxococcales bacterium]|nr:hypothetical protein [Myxococcales bacterium]
MRVPRSEWEGYADNGGYGKLLIGEGYDKVYEPSVYTKMDEPLPWIRP